ncbi:MAG TPA: hypothetical protein VLU94_01760, partial [Candidatus Nitrosotalea sp.]|nr:hypothetical protein [Candidatus Nitrosotalea sp.]
MSCAIIGSYARAAAGPPHLWQSVPDEVFLQEVGHKVQSEEPLNAIAVFEHKVYAGSSKGLYRLDEDRLVLLSEPGGPINRLVTGTNALWAIASHGLYRLQAGAWKRI